MGEAGPVVAEGGCSPAVRTQACSALTAESSTRTSSTNERKMPAAIGDGPEEEEDGGAGRLPPAVDMPQDRRHC